MTTRVQARRASSVSEGELTYIGEIFYDDVGRRFGVFPNDDATTILWLPRWINNALMLNEGQTLSGFDALGDPSSLAIDFKEKDTLQILNRLTGEIYFQLTPNGAVFLRPNDEITEIAGSSNLAINGSLAIKRNIGAKSSFSTIIDDYNFLFAPNWYIYSYPESSGSISVTYEESDVHTDDVILPRVLKATTTGNPSNCGIRSFFYDYNFVQNRIVTVSFRVKGLPGAKAQSRVLTSEYSNLAVIDIEGTGAYQTVSYPCFLPFGSATWWAVDTLYEPGKDTADLTEWQVGGLQVNIGPQRGIYERRTAAVEASLVGSLYKEGRVKVSSNSDVQPVELCSFPLLANKIEFVNPADGTPVTSDLDSTGFNVAIPDTSETDVILKYAAYLAPSPLPE